LPVIHEARTEKVDLMRIPAKMMNDDRRTSTEKFREVSGLEAPEGRFSNWRLKAALFAASRTNGLLIFE